MNHTSFSRRDFLSTATTLGLGAACFPTLAAEARRKDEWQIGCYTRPFDQHDYRTALDSIAEAGFKYCGIMTAKGKSWVVVNVDTSTEEAEQIGEEIRNRGLKVVSLYGGDFPVSKSVDAGIEGLRRLIDHSGTIGCPNLMLGGTTDAALQEAYYQVVRECCPYAASKRIGLSIKPHGGTNATGPECRRIIQSVGAPNFRIWYDPGNIFYYSDGKLDPVDDCPSVDGLVAGVSMKDFLPPKEVLVTPGTGRVNFQKVIEKLWRGGFKKGPLVIECLARGELSQVIGEAKQARRFVEGLIKGLPTQ
jgi:sugar phosphate isomerase/epimerase